MAKMCSFGQEKNYSNLAFTAAFLHILVIAFNLFCFCLVLLCFAFSFLFQHQSIRHYLPMMVLVDLLWPMTMTMTELGLIVSTPMSECYLSRRPIHQHYRHPIVQRCRRNRHQDLHLLQMNYLSYRRSLLLNRHSMHQIYCWWLQFLGLSRLGAMLEDYWSVLVVRCHILYFWQHWLHRMP